MKMRFAPLLFLLFFSPAYGEVDNLNKDSNLIDAGVAPQASPASVLDGIPLMQGLQVATNADDLNILPDFVTTPPMVAVGIVDVDDVYNFYKKTLPPLGWKAASGRDYQKGTTSLHINAQAYGKRSTVRFEETTDAE